jgi:cytochrome c6
MRKFSILLAIAALFAMGGGVQSALADPTGAQLYARKCAACHQSTGKGIKGVFPALAGDKFVLTPKDDAIIHVVLKGRAGMPAFAGNSDDATVASILTHVRSSWGNQAPAVKPETVAKVRAELGKSTVHNINN